MFQAPARKPNQIEKMLPGRLTLALVFVAASSGSHASDDDFFKSASDVNEGQLHFLTRVPDKPVHHHQNRIVISTDSLVTGWVALFQCHDNLDAVPRAQITFREGYVRDLKVESAQGVEDAWIEGASVQLRGVTPRSRLCLSAQTRALRNTGNGYFNLYNGPYMRKFLDGYYPMHVTLDVDYPVTSLRLLDVSPAATEGLTLSDQPGQLHLNALFEGELRTLLQFEQP